MKGVFKVGQERGLHYLKWEGQWAGVLQSGRSFNTLERQPFKIKRQIATANIAAGISDGLYTGFCATGYQGNVKEQFTLQFVPNATGGYNVQGTNTNKFTNLNPVTGVVVKKHAQTWEGSEFTLWVPEVPDVSEPESGAPAAKTAPPPATKPAKKPASATKSKAITKAPAAKATPSSTAGSPGGTSSNAAPATAGAGGSSSSGSSATPASKKRARPGDADGAVTSLTPARRTRGTVAAAQQQPVAAADTSDVVDLADSDVPSDSEAATATGSLAAAAGAGAAAGASIGATGAKRDGGSNSSGGRSINSSASGSGGGSSNSASTAKTSSAGASTAATAGPSASGSGAGSSKSASASAAARLLKHSEFYKVLEYITENVSNAERREQWTTYWEKALHITPGQPVATRIFQHSNVEELMLHNEVLGFILQTTVSNELKQQWYNHFTQAPAVQG